MCELFMLMLKLFRIGVRVGEERSIVNFGC